MSCMSASASSSTMTCSASSGRGGFNGLPHEGHDELVDAIAARDEAAAVESVTPEPEFLRGVAPGIAP